MSTKDLLVSFPWFVFLARRRRGARCVNAVCGAATPVGAGLQELGNFKQVQVLNFKLLECCLRCSNGCGPRASKQSAEWTRRGGAPWRAQWWRQHASFPQGCSSQVSRTSPPHAFLTLPPHSESLTLSVSPSHSLTHGLTFSASLPPSSNPPGP